MKLLFIVGLYVLQMYEFDVAEAYILTVLCRVSPVYFECYFSVHF